MEADVMPHLFGSWKERCPAAGALVIVVFVAAACASELPAEVRGAEASRVWQRATDVLGQPTPDGRLLTFVDWATGDLAVRDVITGQERRLTHHGYPQYALASTVSRDGRQVAYFWTVGGGAAWQAQLRVIGIEGVNERVVVENAGREIGYLTPYDWTPDGRHVLVVVTRGEANEIAFVDVESGTVAPVKRLEAGIPWRAALSPDGEWIAYDLPSTPEAIGRDIHVLGRDGQSGRVIAAHSGLDTHPVWASDGSSIFFLSDRSGAAELWRVPVAEGRAAGEPTLVRRDLPPSFAVMGMTARGALFYSLNSGGGDLYLASFDPEAIRITNEPRRYVEAFAGYNSALQLSGSDQLTVYVGRRWVPGRGMGARVILSDARTGRERITAPAHHKLTRPRLSPDGASVVAFAASPTMGLVLNLIDVASGEWRTVVRVPGEGLLGDVAWLGDGSAFVFFRAMPDSAGRRIGELVRYTLAGGTEEVIWRFEAPGGENAWALSPDQREIAFVNYSRDSSTLRVAPLGGGPSRELLVVRSPRRVVESGGIVWTRDGRHLFFALGEPQQANGEESRSLHVISLAGGEPRSLNITMNLLRHIAVTPDGKRVMWTAGPMDFNEVWMLDSTAVR